ncbi:MAG: hypothetical protein JST80_05585 [Bdellovibrionales bacterium]|nr:hypothetical protein [Bdellovibrionales bacterium]
MKFVIVLFACVVIVAACGKKITHSVTTDMNLAIAQDDGGVYENATQNKFDYTEGEFETSSAKTKGDSQFQIMLNEDHKADRVNSDIWVTVSDGDHSVRHQYVSMNFRLDQYVIARAGNSFKETCYMNHAPGTRCTIGSVILQKENMDSLGNKSRLFKHVSSNYDKAGIKQCDIDFTNTGLDWREAATATPEGIQSPTYKFVAIASDSLTSKESSFKLVVTCFKDYAAEGAKPGLRSVFRGEFSQNRIK